MILMLTSIPGAMAQELYLAKSADTSSISYVGQPITYTYSVGYSRLEGEPSYISGPITIIDDKLGTINIPSTTIWSATTYGTWIYQDVASKIYKVTQDDLNNGYVINSASATCQGLWAYATLSIPPTNPALILQKAATTSNPTDSSTYYAVGQLITYNYTVKNTGNVAISGPITVTDNMFGSSQISSKGLAPGQSVTRGKSYLVTPQDIENGIVINSAFATGSFNDKKVTSDTDKAIAKFFGPTANL
jgi:uncharacterized repeat protein (TIGR01451 family)